MNIIDKDQNVFMLLQLPQFDLSVDELYEPHLFLTLHEVHEFLKLDDIKAIQVATFFPDITAEHKAFLLQFTRNQALGLSLTNHLLSGNSDNAKIFFLDFLQLSKQKQIEYLELASTVNCVSNSLYLWTNYLRYLMNEFGIDKDHELKLTSNEVIAFDHPINEDLHCDEDSYIQRNGKLLKYIEFLEVHINSLNNQVEALKHIEKIS